jgi:hypothetical protein
VELDGKTNDPAQTWSNAYLGRATIELEAGTERFWLRVGGAKSLSGKPLPLGSVLLGPLSADEGEREVRLPAAREIRGLVLDDAGRAVPGASVECVALEDQGSVFEGRARTAYTDDTGRFLIGGVGEGDYAVSAYSRERGRARTTVRSGAGDVTLVLVTGPTAVIKVLDAAGLPVPGVHVTISGRLGTRGCSTGDDGRVTFSDIHRGPSLALHLRASPRTAEASIDPWIPRDTTLRLPAGLRIEGRVVDGDGRPVTDGEVWYRAKGCPWRSTSPEEDGRFAIGGLPSGPVSLLAVPEEVAPSPSDRRTITVPAGSTKVRLAYRAGLPLRLRIRNWKEDGRWHEALLFSDSGETVAECPVGEDGTLEFEGLDERARYGLYLPPCEGGRTLYRTGLRPGPDRVDLSLEAGGTIRGTLVRGAPAEDVGLWLEGPGFRLDAVLLPDGSFEIAAVPSGVFTVVAEGYHGGRPLRASARAGRGDTVQLILGGK